MLAVPLAQALQNGVNRATAAAVTDVLTASGPIGSGECDVMLNGSIGGIYSMAAVLIACPSTNALVPTGMHVPTLDDLEPVNLLIDCPDCGRDHEWTPHDAVLSSYPRQEAATSPR